MRLMSLFFYLLLSCLLGPSAIYAEKGILVIQVSDLEGRPVKGIMISTKGDGSTSRPTDDAGKTRLYIGLNIKEGSPLKIQILPNVKNFIFISPWDGDIIVPSFESLPNNFVNIYVGASGDKALLQNGKALTALTNRIITGIEKKDNSNFKNFKNVGLSIDKQEEIRQKVLFEQATSFGLRPGEVDSAIRNWKLKDNDYYQQGLLAFYEKQYPKATSNFTEAYKEEKNKFVDIIFNLALSLSHEGKYLEAERKLREAVLLKPTDTKILYKYSEICGEIGDCTTAKDFSIKALKIDEKDLASDSLDLYESLKKTASAFINCDDTMNGRIYLERMVNLSIASNAPLYISSSLTLLAMLYSSEGRDPEAKAMLSEAIQIEKKVDSSSLGYIYQQNTLAYFLFIDGYWRQAEDLLDNSITKLNSKINIPNRDSVSIPVSIIQDLILSQDYLTHINFSRFRYDNDCEKRIKYCLKFMAQIFGKYTVPYLEQLTLLGDLYAKQSKYSASETILKELLNLSTIIYGENSPALIPILNNNVKILIRLRKIPEAKAIARQTNAILKFNNDTASYVFFSCNNIFANVYKINKEYDSAYIILKEIYKTSRSLDKMSDMTRLIATWMVDLLIQQNRIIEAKSLIEENIDTAVISPNTITLENKYAYIFKIEQKRKLVEKAYNLSITHAKELYGEINMRTVAQISLLGDFYFSINDFKNCEKEYLKCQQIISALSYKMYGNIVQIMNKLGALYLKQGLNEKAKKNFVKTLEVIDSRENINDILIATTYNNIAKYHFQTKNYHTAQKFNDKALSIMLEANLNSDILLEAIIDVSIKLSKVLKIKVDLQNLNTLLGIVHEAKLESDITQPAFK